MLHDSELFSLEEIKHIISNNEKDQQDAHFGGKVQLLIESMCQNNKTMKDLLIALEKLKDDPNNLALKPSFNVMKQGIENILDDCLEEAKKPKEYTVKPKPIDTLENFVTYMKSKRDGSGLESCSKMTRTEFFIKVAQKEVKPGDTVMMWRKAAGVRYAHAGIFLRNCNQEWLIHVQPINPAKFMFNNRAKICWDNLQKCVKADDKLFVVRRCQRWSDQKEVIRRVLYCLFPRPSLKFTYNGYYGSCQTFCNRIYGVRKLSDLNLEANFTHFNTMKFLLGSFVNDRDRACDLIQKMDARMSKSCRSSQDESDGEESLRDDFDEAGVCILLDQGLAPRGVTQPLGDPRTAQAATLVGVLACLSIFLASAVIIADIVGIVHKAALIPIAFHCLAGLASVLMVFSTATLALKVAQSNKNILAIVSCISAVISATLAVALFFIYSDYTRVIQLRYWNSRDLVAMQTSLHIFLIVLSLLMVMTTATQIFLKLQTRSPLPPSCQQDIRTQEEQLPGEPMRGVTNATFVKE